MNSGNKRDENQKMDMSISRKEKVMDADASDHLLDQVRFILEAAISRKANRVIALNISHVSNIADYVIIAEGRSRAQNEAITYHIEVSCL